MSLPWLIISLLVPSMALDPSVPFPSCLVAGVTWDSNYVIGLVTDVLSPEACQLACSEEDNCAGFTWLSEDSDFLVAHSCLLFSQTGEEIPHGNVVSGPNVCSCTVSGECRAGDQNVISAVPDTRDVAECRILCEDDSACVAFTFLGEGHPLAHLCLLYSYCEDFDDSCTDCTSGVPACQTCAFEEDVIDGLCGGVKLLYSGGGYEYYRIPVSNGTRLEEGAVATTCKNAGMAAVCSGDSDCLYSSDQCLVTPLSTDCNNPMRPISKEICNTFVQTSCPDLDGLFSYMNNWPAGECGVVGTTCCAHGNDFVSGDPIYFAYCVV